MPFRVWLAMVFVVLFAISAIRPWYPQDFLIEHILTVVVAALLIWADHRRTLSNLSVLLIFCYILLHLLGAHYTYSEVPYDAWSESVTGKSISEWFGWTRNHYDRLVHAAFGLLLVYPMRELLARLLPELRLGDVRLLVAAVFVLAVLSKLYELMEWVMALVMTQDAAAMYNGEQGDNRDAQKDMALAFTGTIISAFVIFLCEMPKRKKVDHKPNG